METEERLAVVADELELVRLGIAAVLGPLGIGVCGECRSGGEAADLASYMLPDLVILGSLSDGTTLSGLRQVRAINPPPLTIGLLSRAGDTDVALATAIGVNGLAIRSGGLTDLAVLIERVLKGESVVVPELHVGLIGDLHVRSAEHGLGGLSARECEMLSFLAQGRSNREIAALLSISLATVKTHLVHLYSKLGVNNRNQALARGVELGLLA